LYVCSWSIVVFKNLNCGVNCSNWKLKKISKLILFLSWQAKLHKAATGYDTSGGCAAGLMENGCASVLC
jgi:hypothetical protein